MDAAAPALLAAPAAALAPAAAVDADAAGAALAPAEPEGTGRDFEADGPDDTDAPFVPAAPVVGAGDEGADAAPDVDEPPEDSALGFTPPPSLSLPPMSCFREESARSGEARPEPLDVSSFFD